MIRQLRGTVLSHEPTGIIVEVAGWGVLVNMASPETVLPGSEVTLMTYLSVKQDGMDLYGFPDEAERRFFELLLQVSGVGPKTALSILKRAPREALEGAIAARDLDYLTRVIGLGKKAAEKLIVELSEKVGGSTKVHDDADGEVFDTLVALGYTDREARKAVAAVPKAITGTDARLKAALSSSR
ncbi:MAG: Holliday junction DNA helicase RuvA [Parcubacteria bacterium C7867-004]|nr:MAG: Holliday junction DNA helicase RuvA [Parcubacteria bacterium C7867-004]